MTKTKLKKIKLKLATMASTFYLFLINTKIYAATTIGTQEVETATQNIKDAVIKLAMPVRFSSHVCEYSNYSN